MSESKAGNLEKELKEIIQLNKVDSEVILSFTLGFTEYFSLVCCE